MCRLANLRQLPNPFLQMISVVLFAVEDCAVDESVEEEFELPLSFACRKRLTLRAENANTANPVTKTLFLSF